jgi:hypothetical protein
MERPRGFGVFAKILALLGISALGPLALVSWGHPLVIAPQFLPFGEAVTRWTLFGASLIYCATSFVGAYALWRVRPFARYAFYAWVASLMLYLAVFMFLIRVPKPLGIGILFFALLGAFLYFGWRVVQAELDLPAMRSNNRWRGP